MLKKILGTAGTRLVTAVITFVIVIINARVLGSEGVGEIALIVLGIAIILLISNFVGGGALVYLIPRHNAFLLIVPSYLWAVFSAAGGAYLLNVMHLIPQKFAVHVFLLSLLQALSAVNLTFLLGKEKIKEYNLISVLQFFVLISSLATLFYVAGKKEVMSYVHALYLAFGTSLFISFFLIVRFVKPQKLTGLPEVMKQILKYGSYVQIANILQLMNYRLSYYIIESYIGKSGLGIFDVGNKMSEGVWLMGKSVSMVQYSRISNTRSQERNIELTLRFLKFVFVSTVLMLLVLLLLPPSFFSFLFGKDFTGLELIIRSLAPGILSMSLSMILSHYFSGTGKHYHNTISSGTGLVFTVIFGFTLIPAMGIIGAGITASISYTVSMLYQMTVFVRITKTPVKSLLINKTDLELLKQEVITFVKGEKKQI